MRKLFCSLVFIFSLLPAKAFACSCAPLDTYAYQAYQEATAVILGVPTSARSAGESGFSEEATFTVVSALKGSAENLRVRSRKPGPGCGVTFQPNSGLYLVFVYAKEDGMLYTTFCSSAVIDPENAEVTSTLKLIAGFRK